MITDDDDDDNDAMHNMLSGSTSSSHSTMPLLADSHSHHSFSRISLDEYSPLSLVEDCDNALTISPTSLACGSLNLNHHHHHHHHHHHPFKSSMNSLAKIDNLIGDAHVVGDDVVVGSGEAQPMSPLSASGLLCGSSPTDQLWSNSSTAISQNPALLSSSSSSFLMSHHHHHHSLMHQLEPQSLDETPTPLFGNNHHGASFLGDAGGFASASAATASGAADLQQHRPSSEPLPASMLELNNCADIETKSDYDQATTTTGSSALAAAATTGASSQTTQSAFATSGVAAAGKGGCARQSAGRNNHSGSGRSNKSTATTLSPAALSAQPAPRRQRNRSTASNGSGGAGAAPKRPRTSASRSESSALGGGGGGKSTGGEPNVRPALQVAGVPALDSKVHLQLNHHKKLRELQQRLFGSPAAAPSGPAESAAEQPANGCKQTAGDSSLETGAEVDSSIATRDSSGARCVASAQKAAPSAADLRNSTQTRTRTRPVRDRAKINGATGARANRNDNSATAAAPKSSPATAERRNTIGSSASVGTQHNQRLVKTETAEPDTTTKGAECFKLADLLSSAGSVDLKAAGNSTNLIVNNSSISAALNGSTGSNPFGLVVSKLIQLQDSQSLAVLTNGQLVHTQQLPGGNSNSSSSSNNNNNNSNNNGNSNSGGGNFHSTNQILCRPAAQAIALANQQQQQQVNTTTAANTTPTTTSTSNEPTTAATLLTNWTLQAASQNGAATNGANSSVATTNTVGAHQIAIQVICQDGTSLVLPVSTAAGLNASVSLQALLANNVATGAVAASADNAAAEASQLRSPNQLSIPIVSVTNLAPQQNSGLAASSPTLAALLDAGSSLQHQSSKRGELAGDPNGASFSSSNLLRKLVSGGGSSIAQQQADELRVKMRGGGAGANGDNVEKRVKLEHAEISNAQTTTLTLVESRQGLLVANGNETGAQSAKHVGKRPQQHQQHQQQQQQQQRQQIMAGDQNVATTKNGNCTEAPAKLQAPLTNNLAAELTTTSTTTADNKSSSKQNKMASSTGNRQVDPAQPFRCEHCNSTFTRLGNFTRHKKIHTVPTKDGQRFKCEVCSKSFLQRCDLARHLHIHRGTEPHRCNICGKGYIRHSDLVTHQRFHNKEKPFGCPHCSKGFCQRGDLNRHLRSIHLQMKPILCPCCNRKFAKQETLIRHLNTAHRTKAGPATVGTNTIIAELPPSYTITQSTTNTNDNQADASISTSGTNATLNINSSSSSVSSNNSSESSQVSSLQAIQATLSQVQSQSVDSQNPVDFMTIPASITKVTKAISCLEAETKK